MNKLHLTLIAALFAAPVFAQDATPQPEELFFPDGYGAWTKVEQGIRFVDPFAPPAEEEGEAFWNYLEDEEAVDENGRPIACPPCEKVREEKERLQAENQVLREQASRTSTTTTTTVSSETEGAPVVSSKETNSRTTTSTATASSGMQEAQGSSLLCETESWDYRGKSSGRLVNGECVCRKGFVLWKAWCIHASVKKDFDALEELTSSHERLESAFAEHIRNHPTTTVTTSETETKLSELLVIYQQKLSEAEETLAEKVSETMVSGVADEATKRAVADALADAKSAKETSERFAARLAEVERVQAEHGEAIASHRTALNQHAGAIATLEGKVAQLREDLDNLDIQATVVPVGDGASALSAELIEAKERDQEAREELGALELRVKELEGAPESSYYTDAILDIGRDVLVLNESVQEIREVILKANTAEKEQDRAIAELAERMDTIEQNSAPAAEPTVVASSETNNYNGAQVQASVSVLASGRASDGLATTGAADTISHSFRQFAGQVGVDMAVLNWCSQHGVVIYGAVEFGPSPSVADGSSVLTVGGMGLLGGSFRLSSHVHLETLVGVEAHATDPGRFRSTQSQGFYALGGGRLHVRVGTADSPVDVTFMLLGGGGEISDGGYVDMNGRVLAPARSLVTPVILGGLGLRFRIP